MLLLSLLASAHAAPPAPANPSDEVDPASGHLYHYAERTLIEFEGVDVKGELVKPSGIATFDRRAVRFPPMTWIRQDWHDQLTASVDEVK